MVSFGCDRFTRFDDTVAISSCAIIHYYGYCRYLEHHGYDIPYRCLVPLKIDNLLPVGRCISSEQQPYESHRATVNIMAIGQAAGTAAALCCRTACCPRELDVPLLRKTLEAQGAVLRIDESKGRSPPLHSSAMTVTDESLGKMRSVFGTSGSER